MSSLATVEEIPGGGTDENVLDKHGSGSPASAQEIPEEVDEKELGKHSSWSLGSLFESVAVWWV